MLNHAVGVTSLKTHDLLEGLAKVNNSLKVYLKPNIFQVN